MATNRNQARRRRGTLKKQPRTTTDNTTAAYWRAVERDEYEQTLISSEPRQVIAYWRSRLTQPTFVYFITEYADYLGNDIDSGTIYAKRTAVKIGLAKDPIARVAELQCGNPRDLYVTAVLLGGRDVEQLFHEYWQPERINREWFGTTNPQAILAIAGGLSEAQIREHQGDATIDYVQRPLLSWHLYGSDEGSAKVQRIYAPGEWDTDTSSVTETGRVA